MTEDAPIWQEGLKELDDFLEKHAPKSTTERIDLDRSFPEATWEVMRVASGEFNDFLVETAGPDVAVDIRVDLDVSGFGAGASEGGAMPWLGQVIAMGPDGVMLRGAAIGDLDVHRVLLSSKVIYRHVSVQDVRAGAWLVIHFGDGDDDATAVVSIVPYSAVGAAPLGSGRSGANQGDPHH